MESAVRVVGYVREAAGPAEAEPVFAQSERIRRWVSDTGHQLVAVFQDARTPGRELGRAGFQALLGAVASGQVDAVVLPDLTVLSPDKVTQEVMLWDLRSRGVSVLSTADDDLGVLTEPPEEQIRIIVRDVLAKVTIHNELTGDEIAGTEVLEDGTAMAESDVIVELIAPQTETSATISPAP